MYELSVQWMVDTSPGVGMPDPCLVNNLKWLSIRQQAKCFVPFFFTRRRIDPTQRPHHGVNDILETIDISQNLHDPCLLRTFAFLC